MTASASSVSQRLSVCGVIPVVAIARAEDAPLLGAELAKAGLPCAEITLRTAAGIEAISRLRAAEPEMLVGAGTVLSAEQATRAIDAGAQFIVTPGFAAGVVSTSQARGVPVYPGVMTPTEVMAALDAGLTDLKFFPAETAGGLPQLRALAGPFPGVRFIPTGGISLANLAAYLAQPNVLAVGGSWMVRSDLLAAGDWAAVGALAAEAVRVVRAAREPAAAGTDVAGQPA